MISKSVGVFRAWNKMLGGHQVHWFSSSGCSPAKEVWDLFSAVCLERRPIVTFPPTDLEIKFKNLIEDIEFENSFKSDHELRKEKERHQAELLKKGKLDNDVDIAVKTSQDLEDAYQEEFSKFRPASRRTEADEKNDIRSLDRALDKYLILVVNQKIGETHKWVLPQGRRESGETMRQAAERVLVERCGDNLKAHFLGNAPCGCYKYKYPQSLRNESIGAKIFFFKAWHLDGQVQCNNSLVKDFRWTCTEELSSNLENDVYFNCVSQFLITQ